MSQLIPSTTPSREFKDHEGTVTAVAPFPDRQRMVTSSEDKTLRLWDLNTGIMLNKMEGHRGEVWALGLSRDGQLIASGDENGELMAWHGETGEPLTQTIKAHSTRIMSLDFSPGGTMLATGSRDGMTILLSMKTWQLVGNPIRSSGCVVCVRHSPSGELLAIATTNNIEIYNPPTSSECVANFKAHIGWILSLAWTPDGTHLLSGGYEEDPTIRVWDASTWQQVGDAWTGHTSCINAIAIHPSGTLVASASNDSNVCLWRLSDRQTIAIFQHSSPMLCVTFSADGKHILSGGQDEMISEWAVPKLAQILAINTTARNACIAGDLPTAEQLLTQEINIDANNYASYADRSLLMARKHNWDNALQDATKSVDIQPSLTGYISKGIALLGKKKILDAMSAFDVAFLFANEDSNIIHFILLIKACHHDEAILFLDELVTVRPDDDPLACRIVGAYLLVQLGSNAMDDGNHNQAADWLAVAVGATGFSSTYPIHSMYEDLVVLFGWDLKSLWRNARQKGCEALLRACRLEEALELYRDMMNLSNENTKASDLDWSNGKSGSIMSCRLQPSSAFYPAFKQECSTLCVANGDAALTASDYDTAIESYSAAIDLNSASDTILANRSKARLGILLWEDALLDADKVIELNPSSHVGYQLKYAALHGAQRYDEAIEAFQMMLSKLDGAPDTQIRKFHDQYVSPSKAAGLIQNAIGVQLDAAPLRLLNTATGLVCDREAQISAFKTSTEYTELLLLTVKHPDLRMERIAEAVAMYFRCAMLSHRWDGKEPLLHEIQGKVVYKLKAAGSTVKLQSFCKLARDTGYHWAWVDSCCIDQNNNVELSKSLNSMFSWYRCSALTAVYLSDVPPSSKSGALAKSAWNTRGWTVPEFLAPNVIRFYQQDWTPYLDVRSLNHKESAMIMEELQDATGIDACSLVTFQPGMRDPREKLQWASTRVTTVPEDGAYSLFGIFGVQLPILYGENKQKALGRLLQMIVARSGDITVLDWIGKSSEFNSCLPADISSYGAPPYPQPSLSNDEMQMSLCLLQSMDSVELASKLYSMLENLTAPRFADCRLHLPCIAFRITEVKRRPGEDQGAQSTYGLKADGLHDLLITTEDKLIQFSRARPTRQTFLLVRPWDRRLLELPDFAECSEPESPLDDKFPGGSPEEEELADSESHSRALQLMVRLGLPFGSLLLAQQRGGEYKRIASDHDIIAQVKDIAASVHNVMDIRTVEILRLAIHQTPSYTIMAPSASSTTTPQSLDTFAII
ncbi:hypothetical protein DFH29DRAFT_1074959 [Suillus ampliporus]|nr:hypothetical protein DFH29DRAFT_1074959 [Suillus ampliporus]